VSRYAANTSVPVERSRAEIEKTLVRYGATGFGYSWDRRIRGSGAAEEHAVLVFALGGRRVQLDVVMPEAPKEQRQRWRALLLVVKAKLEAVESGLGTLESEFLANIVMKDGRTVGAAMLPRLTEAVETGRLLPAAGEAGHG
jgi:hypothetical protein